MRALEGADTVLYQCTVSFKHRNVISMNNFDEQ